MKLSLLLLGAVVFASFLFPTWSNGETRTWTRKDGKTVEAELIGVAGTVLRLKTATGAEFDIEAAELSLNDQHYVMVSQKEDGEKEPVVPTFTFWAYTDDARHAGTDSLGLYLEFNGREDLRQVLPTRNFAWNGVEEFSDLKLGISPEQVESVRIVVLKGDDAWGPKKYVFQFRDGDRVSEKIEFHARRWFSLDEREADTEETIVFKEPIELTEDLSSMETRSSDDVTILEPSRIENVLPSMSTADFREDYIAESNETRGRLEMEFTHENIGSSLVKIRSLTLVMHVPNAKHAETGSTIAVWAKDELIASQKGARRGAEIRLKLDPDAFDGRDSIEIVVKCGDDAVRISKKEKAPFLEAVFE